ncbi:hypothetical protein [Streptomyces chartreusis]
MYADSDQLWIDVPSESVLPVHGPGGTAERSLTVRVSHDNTENEVGAGRRTVDASEVASFARVSWPSNCVPESAVKAVCDYPGMPAERTS